MKEVKKISLICLIILSIGSSVKAQSRKISSYNTCFKTIQKDSLPPKQLTFLSLFKSENKMPFFCAVEEKMYKSSGISFRFRLGSVSYADFLEGKHKVNIGVSQY